MATRRIQVEIVGDSRSVERAFGRANRAGATFGARMKSIAKIASVGLVGAFVAVGVALRRGFQEFMQSQKVMAQARAVIKSTGGVANVTAKHVDQLATKLSLMSGVDDEVIGAGENMLLTFTNIRNVVGKNNDIFDQATKVALDMSVAMGRDLQPITIMVGKALNDLTVNSKGTITGWSALRRVGVQITPMMMKQAAAFIKAGKPLKAQQLLLKELNTEFGGSARAFGMTLPGAFAKLKNATDEVLGAFAQGLAPVVQKVANTLATKMADPAFVARVQRFGHLVGVTLLNAFKAVSAWFQANWPQIRSGFLTAVNVAQRFANVLRQIVNITPGGPNTLIGLIVSGVLLSKTLKILGALRTVGGLRGRGGGGAGGKGRAGKKLLSKAAPYLAAGATGAGATAAAATAGVLGVLASAGSGRVDDRSGKYPNTAKAFALYYKHALGPAATAILRKNLTGYSMKNAPDKALRHAEQQLSALYGRQPAPAPRMSGDMPGDVIHVHVHLDKQKVGQAVINTAQRTGKNNKGSRRGRYGGQNLALG